jgi:hypothetical protein
MPSVLTDDEIKDRIRKFEVLIDEAQKQGADVKHVEATLQGAVTSYYNNKSDDAYLALMNTRVELSQIVQGLKDRKYLYLWAIYGIWPIIYGLVWFVFLGYTLLYWPPFGLKVPTQPFGVPAWAALVAGLGACVQIFVDVVSDVKDDGVVQGFRRDWYIVLPFVSLVFGVVAYLLVGVGVLSITSGSSSATSGSQTATLFIITFLSGYSTDWFMGKLSALTSSTAKSSTKS